MDITYAEQVSRNVIEATERRKSCRGWNRAKLDAYIEQGKQAVVDMACRIEQTRRHDEDIQAQDNANSL